MRKRRPSVGGIGMNNYPNKSGGSLELNAGEPPLLPPTVSNVQLPTAESNAVVGQVLTATYDLGGGTPDTIVRTWYRDGVEIFSSTSSDSYTLVQADASNTANITVNVAASNISGSNNATSNTIAVIYDAMAWDYRQRVIAKGSPMTLERLQLLQELVVIPQKDTLNKVNFGAGVNKGRVHIYLAADDIQARENLINSNFTVTTINTPTFTADAYYTGGTGRALNTNRNPSTLSLGTNNIVIAAVFNNIPTSGLHIFGMQSSTAANSVYGFSDATSVAGRILQTNERSGALANSRIGLNAVRRNGNNLVFNNSTSQSTVVDAATGTYANLNEYDLALNANGSVSLGSNRQQIASFAGAYITDAELNSLYGAIRDYCLSINPGLAI